MCSCTNDYPYDQSAKLRAFRWGRNKTERFFGYYTWHADDAPDQSPPLGDLFKTQVWALARNSVYRASLSISYPPPTLSKVKPTKGFRDFLHQGGSYPRPHAGAERRANLPLRHQPEEVALVRKKKVNSTHWKRKTPTTAMISTTAINEYYLRPVDY
ncbi:MAG: hypothetical protein R2688_07230 [Fimbriimonadaceae bacterium]